MFDTNERTEKPFIPTSACFKNNELKHADPPDKIRLCHDVRGERCVYMKHLNINNDYVKINRKYCLYQFKN